MAITPTLLVNDLLPGTATTLYTVPASNTALIKSIVLVELDGADREVTLYVTRGSDDGYLLNAAYLPSDGRMVSETPLTLEAGDVLAGFADTADVVSILVSGAELT